MNEAMEKGSLGEAVAADIWRLGLAELPERFRIVWARLDARLAVMREQEAFHTAEVRRLDAAIAEKRRSVGDLVLQVRESLRPELDASLRAAGEAHRRGLPGVGEAARRLLALEKLYAAASAFPVPGRLGSFLPGRRRREGAKEFFGRCLDLATVFLAAPPPLPSPGLPLSDLKAAACARLYDACRRLHQELLEQLVAAELPRRPEQEQILVLESEMERIELERRRIEVLFAETAAARSRLRERHANARQAVLDIGREIAGGRRTAGEGAPLALCATCSALMPADTPACSLCGVPQRSTSELRVPCPDSPVSA